MVIAIIGILASMLLPALSTARETARGAICKNNLKQISAFAQFYMNDYDEHSVLWQVPPGAKIWDYSLGINYMNYGATQTEVDQKILDGNTLHICPSHKHVEGRPGVVGSFGRCYGVNTVFNYTPGTTNWQQNDFWPRSSNVKCPSDLIYFMDSDLTRRVDSSTTAFIYGIGLSLINGHMRIDPKMHLSTTNQVYFDGHVGPGIKWGTLTGWNQDAAGKKTWSLNGQ